MPDTFNPAVQPEQNGPFTDEFLDCFNESKLKHKLTQWQIAEWAEWSPSYLGNMTRYKGDQKPNVNTEFANRLAVVVDALKRATVGIDLKNLFPNKKAPTAREPTASVVDTNSLEHAFAILQRFGFASVTVAFPTTGA